MTHQASGQWDKEYPGHRATKDQLLGENAGAHCESAPNTRSQRQRFLGAG